MIDLQNHIRNRDALNLFDGLSTYKSTAEDRNVFRPGGEAWASEPLKALKAELDLTRTILVGEWDAV